MPHSGGAPDSIAIFDSNGTLVTEKTTLEYLSNLMTELDDFERVLVDKSTHLYLHTPPIGDQEEVVEVRGSSECFEYQFPASPEYFVGRQATLKDLDGFLTKVVNKETSARGLLFEANSGWGKSSAVLASVDRLAKDGHFAVAIDSRSASSSRFLLKVVEHCLKKFGDFEGKTLAEENMASITGFEGAFEVLSSVGRFLENSGKTLFIFLDQFENVFFQPDILKKIADLLLRLCDAQTNVVLGFSWKTDLVGSTQEFPYILRDSIIGSSKRMILGTFSEEETNALLNQLEEEIQQTLRKDLKFFISEFSQGYPWLLKKLCAHVKSQREAGVPQQEIANSLLNIEELFQEDLQGLSVEQEDVLKRIARVAPVSLPTIDEEFSPEIVRSLVNARLVVRIGSKYDIYWDIFRDYLNMGQVPIQENYILRIQFRSIFKDTKLLAEWGGELETSKFLGLAELSQSSFYNVARDMKLAGIATTSAGKVTLQLNVNDSTKAFEDALRVHLREKLPRNRLVSRLLETLEAQDYISIREAGVLLKSWCPYISASDKTWHTYARVFATWTDFAELTTFDNDENLLIHYASGKEVRKRDSLLPKRRGGITVPSIQYKPIEEAILRIVYAAQTNKAVDWTGIKKSTITKSVGTLEDVGFIVRKHRSITVLPVAVDFAANPGRRSELFAEGALRIKAFAAFVEILETHKEVGRTLHELGEESKIKLGAGWKESTAETNAKIMLDWARHTDLAPGSFSDVRRGPKKGWKHADPNAVPLFDNHFLEH